MGKQIYLSDKQIYEIDTAKDYYVEWAHDNTMPSFAAYIHYMETPAFIGFMATALIHEIHKREGEEGKGFFDQYKTSRQHPEKGFQNRGRAIKDVKKKNAQDR